jgi:RimJ/RimL family protein N-acetyltransferase
MKGALSLTDGVVVLERFRADDMEAHLAGEDEEQARRFGWWPRRSGPEQFRALLAEDEASWSRGGPNFRLATRVRGELVGGCELRVRKPGSATVSYWTFASHRGCGYATRATRLLCDWAFEALRLERVEAHVEEDNAASVGVARAAGFIGTPRRDDEGLLVLERRA